MWVTIRPISSMCPITSSRLGFPRVAFRAGTSASGVPTPSVLTSAKPSAAVRHSAAGAVS